MDKKSGHWYTHMTTKEELLALDKAELVNIILWFRENNQMWQKSHNRLLTSRPSYCKCRFNGVFTQSNK